MVYARSRSPSLRTSTKMDSSISTSSHWPCGCAPTSLLAMSAPWNCKPIWCHPPSADGSMLLSRAITRCRLVLVLAARIGSNRGTSIRQLPTVNCQLSTVNYVHCSLIHCSLFTVHCCLLFSVLFSVLLLKSLLSLSLFLCIP